MCSKHTIYNIITIWDLSARAIGFNQAVEFLQDSIPSINNPYRSQLNLNEKTFLIISFSLYENQRCKKYKDIVFQSLSVHKGWFTAY